MSISCNCLNYHWVGFVSFFLLYVLPYIPGSVTGVYVVTLQDLLTKKPCQSGCLLIAHCCWVHLTDTGWQHHFALCWSLWSHSYRSTLLLFRWNPIIFTLAFGFSWLEIQLLLSFLRQAQHKGCIDYSSLSKGRYQKEFCLSGWLQRMKDLHWNHFQHSGNQDCREPEWVLLIFNSLLLRLTHFNHLQKQFLVDIFSILSLLILGTRIHKFGSCSSGASMPI